MSDKFELEYKIRMTVRREKGLLYIESGFFDKEKTRFVSDGNTGIVRAVIDTTDKAVWEALIELGWTPPTEAPE